MTLGIDPEIPAKPLSDNILGENGNDLLHRNEIHFRFRTHVHEYICPASPEKKDLGNQSIFAGGGITNCPDWQLEFAELVNEKLSELIATGAATNKLSFASILNPRQIKFPIADPNASLAQITWEHNYLQCVKAISLWFPKDSEGPISLFETGKWMMHPKPLFLGIEPEYPRKDALIAHVQAVRPNIRIAKTLQEHADNVALWAAGIGKVDLPISTQRVNPRTLYLAGGITGCPDWQAEISNLLNNSTVKIVNPRRSDFVKGTAAQYINTVRENRFELEACEATVMWFPKEKLTPIALLELGSLLASNKPIFIGVEQGYTRRQDVEIQTALERPEIEIAYSLKELADQVKSYYAMR